MGKLILVTGGTGYIGSHTAVELINEGYDVVIIDNLCNSNIEVIDNIKKITGVKPSFEKFDLCDKKELKKFFKKYPGISSIVHFAALKAVGESVNIPLDYYRNNIESLINLLTEMEEFNIPSMVFSSSCTVYGQPDKLPVTEDSPIKKAESPYGNTKQISEEIIQDAIVANKKINAVCLRYFNPVGAHRSALIGELPKGVPLNLVPFVTQTAAGVLKELRVFGSDYDTPDGTGIRDYINIEDLAKAHVTAVDRLLNGKNKTNCEIFNLGTGKGTSVLEIINTFEKVTGIRVNYKIVDRRKGDVAEVWADASLANRELGWKAVVPLEETLLSSWNWEKNIRNI